MFFCCTGECNQEWLEEGDCTAASCVAGLAISHQPKLYDFRAHVHFAESTTK